MVNSSGFNIDIAAFFSIFGIIF